VAPGGPSACGQAQCLVPSKGGHRPAHKRPLGTQGVSPSLAIATREQEAPPALVPNAQETMEKRLPCIIHQYQVPGVKPIQRNPFDDNLIAWLQGGQHALAAHAKPDASGLPILDDVCECPVPTWVH